MTPKILILEDTDYVRDFIMIFLGKRNLEITMVYNGKEGLEETKKTNFDLIISDVNMPHMNGFQFGMKLREKSPNPHIIFFSAEIGGKEAYQSYLSQITNCSYLEKNFMDLLNAIEEFVGPI